MHSVDTVHLFFLADCLQFQVDHILVQSLYNRTPLCKKTVWSVYLFSFWFLRRRLQSCFISKLICDASTVSCDLCNRTASGPIHVFLFLFKNESSTTQSRPHTHVRGREDSANIFLYLFDFWQKDVHTLYKSHVTIAVFSQIGLDDFVVYEGVRGNSFVRHTTVIMPEEAVRLETIEARHFFLSYTVHLFYRSTRKGATNAGLICLFPLIWHHEG